MPPPHYDFLIKVRPKHWDDDAGTHMLPSFYSSVTQVLELTYQP